MCEALRARFDALELARTTIDAAAGLAEGADNDRPMMLRIGRWTTCPTSY
jgi:hypothetical protein